jgi:predicted aspartyl protease
MSGMAMLLLVLRLIASTASHADAQSRSEDLPPPPGALERELSLPPLSKPPAPLPEGVPNLANPIEIPFILEGGHIIVEASIDGGSPKPFMFDTGARTTIMPDVAKPLNADEVRTSRLGGIGPDVSQVKIIKVREITIGAALLDHPVVAVLDIRNSIVDRGSRPRLSGLIGSELIGRYAVTIDYGRRTLTLNNPGTRPRQATFSLPLGFSMSQDGIGHPSVAAELDGASGDFIIDTGSAGQVFLSATFAQQHAALTP